MSGTESEDLARSLDDPSFARFCGAEGVEEALFAVFWLVVGVASRRHPRGAFATATSVAAVLLLLGALLGLANPDFRESPVGMILRAVFVLLMYWGWQTARSLHAARDDSGSDPSAPPRSA